jgi:pilus assembly protein TadC
MIEFFKRWAKNTRLVLHKTAVILAFILTILIIMAVPMIFSGVAIAIPIGLFFGKGVGFGIGAFFSFFVAMSLIETLDIDNFTDYFGQYMPED